MEHKTTITAEEGQPGLTLTREFDLPVELLYKAHVEPGLFGQWMSHEYGACQVVKWEQQDQGGWQFQTIDGSGNVLFGAKGVFHSFIRDKRITRTFEMESGTFDVQLEFLEFEDMGGERSKLTMQSIYRSAALRDQMLKLPFREGLSMAHDRLEKMARQLSTK